MTEFQFRLPDLGEGTVSAEIVAWRVEPGEAVQEGQAIAELSTDKAVVELPSPVTGRVLARQGEPGDAIAVGAVLISFELAVPGEIAAPVAAVAVPQAQAARATTVGAPAPAPENETRRARAQVLASPATRRRAREAGIDLSTLAGSGPGGRVRREDLSEGGAPDGAAPMGGASDGGAPAVRPATDEIPLIGVRRVIAERMALAQRTIPHFSYVEECDVTELESLRQYLNRERREGARLTLLPFVVAALARVLALFPECNAHYDATREVLVRHRAVHVGIATQTADGLKVPVVRDVQALGFEALVAGIRRVSEAARGRQAARELFTGSTITVTSLGRLGGIASTPIINSPEVAIVGVNRMSERPAVHRGSVAIRQLMNLSSSFDHRFVDGAVAAAMIQALRERLEHPATLFMPSPDPG
jgi:2-oxoisovalerate dehydrogenase E2 component (dihydrolipoyl transacylase)